MPKNKKQESSSSDDSSSEEVQKQQPVKGKAATPAKKEEKKPVKKQESSDDSSSEEKPKKAAKGTPSKKEEPKKAAKKEESSDDSSSEEKPKKAAAKKDDKKKAKKESSSEASSDESEEKPAKNDKKRKAESSDDEESEEKPAAKKAKTDAGAVTTSTTQAAAPAAAGDNNRLFLGNLSFKIDDDAIRAFFKDVGELTDIHWVTDKETGKFYGTGFVAFATAAEAKAAVAKAGQNVLDRPIKIDFAQSRGERTPNKGGFEKKSFGDKPQREQRAPTPKPDGCTTVFLGNLSFQIDENAVRTHFADCGEIANIRWVERDGQFKGCGFVEFAATEGTDKAVALNGSDLMGRAVRVDYSAPKPKKEW